jgi:hypothetical protein
MNLARKYREKIDVINKLVFKLNEKRCGIMNVVCKLKSHDEFNSTRHFCDADYNKDFTILITSLTEIPFKICELYVGVFSELVLDNNKHLEYKQQKILEKKLKDDKVFGGCSTLIEYFKNKNNKELLNKFFKKFDFVDRRDTELLTKFFERINITSEQGLELSTLLSSGDINLTDEQKQILVSKTEAKNTDTKMEYSELESKYVEQKSPYSPISPSSSDLSDSFDNNPKKIKTKKRKAKMSEDNKMKKKVKGNDKKTSIKEDNMNLDSENNMNFGIENKHFEKLVALRLLNNSPLRNSRGDLKISLYDNSNNGSHFERKYNVVFDEDSSNYFEKNITDVEEFVDNLWAEILSLNDDFHRTLHNFDFKSEVHDIVKGIED